MRFFNSTKKRFHRITMIAVLLMISIIAIYAIFQSSFTVENNFPVLRLNVTMKEVFTPPEQWKGEKITKQVLFKNDGDVPALLRVRYSEQWLHGDQVLSNRMERNGVNESIVYKECSDDGWIEQSMNWKLNDKDQWYYYSYVLSPGEEIKILEAIEIMDMKDLPSVYQDAQYQLRIHYEYLEVDKEEVNALWNLQDTYEIKKDGSIIWNF